MLRRAASFCAGPVLRHRPLAAAGGYRRHRSPAEAPRPYPHARSPSPVRVCAWWGMRACARVCTNVRMGVVACAGAGACEKSLRAACMCVRFLPLVRLGPATAHASVMPWHAQINRARTRALAGALTQSNTRAPTARHMHAHTHIHTRTFARVPLACTRLVACSHAPLGTMRWDRHPLPRPRPGRHLARRTTVCPVCERARVARWW